MERASDVNQLWEKNVIYNGKSNRLAKTSNDSTFHSI